MQVGGLVTLRGDLVAGVGIDIAMPGGTEDFLHCLGLGCKTSFAFRDVRVAPVVSLVVLTLDQGRTMTPAGSG